MALQPRALNALLALSRCELRPAKFTPHLLRCRSLPKGQAPKTFAAQLAELQAECVREGIAEGSPEYNDFVMDLLANSRQVRHRCWVLGVCIGAVCNHQCRPSPHQSSDRSLAARQRTASRERPLSLDNRWLSYRIVCTLFPRPCSCSAWAPRRRSAAAGGLAPAAARLPPLQLQCPGRPGPSPLRPAAQPWGCPSCRTALPRLCCPAASAWWVGGYLRGRVHLLQGKLAGAECSSVRNEGAATCCSCVGTAARAPQAELSIRLFPYQMQYFAGGRHGVVQAAQTLKAMPSRLTELLGSKVYIVADVYRAAVGMQKELADSAGSAAMLAQLPSLPPDETRAHGLQFVLTLEGISLSSVGSSGSVASGSVARSNRTVGAKQPAGRAGRGHTASRQETESSFAELWKGAATELIAASGVARGPVTLTCEWGPLLSLLREHGIATCPQLSAAWQVMALRSLASVERVQRHLKLYVCVQDPSIAGTQFVPLPTRFQPRDYTTSKLAQL